MEKKEVLSKYFGYHAFRPGQERLIDAVLSGRDVLCVMPTGAGKSLCYQIPALMTEGITLVISPLISLMQDQVTALVRAGIPAAYLNSSLSPAQFREALRRLEAGRYRLVYVAPERLALPGFQSLCARLPIAFVAVDEAHCISQWGQDFRPDYLRIPEFLAALPRRPVVGAYTATATAQVKGDIAAALGLRDPLSEATGFDRPNLFFSVRRPKNKNRALLQELEKHPGQSGIVYCATRKKTEEVCALLREEGYAAGMYHAGMEKAERMRAQEDFLHDRVQVIAATNAFGMGIDKSNVSFVIHYNLPASVEAYYQEAGRAGRDGERADCVLLYAPGDVVTQRYLIEHSEPNPALTEAEQDAVRRQDEIRLNQMRAYAAEGGCLRNYLLRYFGEQPEGPCGRCSNCRGSFTETDMTAEARTILRCISQTGERFGVGVITNVLRGSESAQITSRNLTRVETYGALRALSQDAVRRRIRALQDQGLLVEVGDYHVLALTVDAGEVLHGERTVTLREDAAAAVKQALRKPRAETEADDPALFEALRQLRLSLARQLHCPPYVIFSDATLRSMCAVHPTTPEELLEVSGVGEVKAARYGGAFLACIRECS